MEARIIRPNAPRTSELHDRSSRQSSFVNSIFTYGVVAQAGLGEIRALKAIGLLPAARGLHDPVISAEPSAW
ncbi:hypothetical protein MES4922_230081 [Mesorhizobium ventifaucium]|uniref:Tn3 transposase DDE domain-containing protein n=1 Tax=Mesorhizobium ventifaucium TaxID=666020 RepID=A0ABM9DTI0_9HYPH|nr:hypothetical protein MES4922_230081 [Mesorhizobium ventifaucium]